MSTHAPINGKTSAELREAFLQNHAAPFAAAVFARDEDVLSVLVVVAQLPLGDVEDAVHVTLIPTPDGYPTWPECMEGSPFHAFDENGAMTGELTERGSRLIVDETFPALDPKQSAITAFAAYCRDGAVADDPITQSAKLYAVIRREEADPEVVGFMMRPAWEDQFDVGAAVTDKDVVRRRLGGEWSAAAPESGQAAGATESATAPATRKAAEAAPPKKGGLFGRMFGRGKS